MEGAVVWVFAHGDLVQSTQQVGVCDGGGRCGFARTTANSVRQRTVGLFGEYYRLGRCEVT